MHGYLLNCGHLFIPTEGRTIPTELRGQALELRKSMKYDDTEREGSGFLAMFAF